MNSSPAPTVKDLVLIGGGHSHVSVLKSFGMRPFPGVRVTVISRDIDTPYSGMLPGFIAGHYRFDEVHIDLGPLARFAGARLYHDEVTGLDLENKRVLTRNRPPVPYDILSINVGSTPRLDHVPGAAESAVAVKPINNFVARWNKLRDRVLEFPRKLRIAVVGAGAGGVELTLAIQFALGKRLVETGQVARKPEFHVFGADSTILPTHNDRVKRKFEKVFAERGIETHMGARVVEVTEGSLYLENGTSYPADEILWVTEASPPAWLRETGLALNPRGFIEIDETLQSTSHPGVFAVGDVATSISHPREKAGVFAVRQGKPLGENLRRALLGEAPKRFVPQEKFLSLISTGDKYAVASRGHGSTSGRWVWRWKDWIDRRFMDRFNVLPEMETEEQTEIAPGLADSEVLEALSTVAMRCGGCGAKVGSTVLERALARIDTRKLPDVLIGLDHPDDAAVSELPPGKLLVQSVDAFRSMIDDPYLFGKITAHHALGDIFAMGAEPRTALAIATVPYAVEEKIEQTLYEMLAGAVEVFDACDTALVGGHTTEGAELSLGFSVNGMVDRERILKKSGMRPGDALILTKPLGTGTLFAAHMRLKAKGRWIDAALESMTCSNAEAAACLHRSGATAATDVTGFGLIGHLVEMTRASGLGATIQLDAVPFLDGALDCVKRGIFSSLQGENLRLRRALENLEAFGDRAEFALLFDPQTAGGFLASLPGDRAEACLEELRSLGYDAASIIGGVTEQSDKLGAIRLEG